MQSAHFFKRILVPIDGSVPSIVAQEIAALIATKFNSEVTVLHVASHELMMPQMQQFLQERKEAVPISTSTGQFPRAVEVPKTPETPLPEEVVNEITNWYIEQGKRIIASAAALFKEEGITVNQKLVERGDPADTIINEAEMGNYDLIVIGNSGEEERDPHLGSVAKKVSAQVKIPVLVAREKSQISKILVPMDGSANAEKALQYAVLLAEKTNAKISLLYVQESTLFRLRPETTKKIGVRVLAQAAAKVEGIKPDQKLESGDPAKVIIQTATDENYDLIVIGGKGHGTIRRFLLGSVSDHAVHYTDRSVLLIK